MLAARGQAERYARSLPPEEGNGASFARHLR